MVEQIISLAKNTAVTDPQLSGNGVGLEGITALATALQSNATLQALDLADNKLTPTALAPMIELLRTKQCRLRTLSFWGNAVGVGNEMDQLLRGSCCFQLTRGRCPVLRLRPCKDTVSAIWPLLFGARYARLEGANERKLTCSAGLAREPTLIPG